MMPILWRKGKTMINLQLNDHTAEDIKYIQELQALGIPDERIQKLYNMAYSHRSDTKTDENCKVHAVITRPPEWGARFQFPENMKFEYDGRVHTLVNDIVVKMAEKYDNFIVEQIAKEAKASGVSDVTVLNKNAIINALRKETPQQVNMNEIEILCPTCRYDMMGLWDYPDVQDPNYCPICGQKLKWRTNDGR